ncbi:Crp/Fnr family transcriptional regulator [Tuberibacillus sp. Marseille-P3662]|uniref:Crp/Fnr family transcriptional regulator n=1 Tax=Tuberibacillus sp. Marseille-P3662 TaxID=1965358 RepID=UPI0020CB0C5D|nr:Crp/Fnr family transcriptional regulator [Tuberibacillus sp. Marseille-P3662]
MPHMMDILRGLPLFSELNDEELKKLEAITKKKTYSKRQYIFMEGEPREAVYFIQKGSVKIFKVDENGNEQVINLLQKGEMFPHIGFFDTTPYPATAEIIETAELFVIRIDDFDNLLIEQPAIALKVMKIMGQKLLNLQQRVQELISQDTFHRTVRTLLRLADEVGETNDQEVRINMPITNQDFANMVGSTRETINRVLGQLKKEGLLETDRHGIFIYDLQKLKNYH